MRKKAYIWISVILSVLFVVLGAVIFSRSYQRLWETVVDLWGSLRIYFCRIFGIEENIEPTVMNYSEVLGITSYFPSDWSSFKEDSLAYWQRFFDIKNFKMWLLNVSAKLSVIVKVIIFILPICIILFIVIRRIYRIGNNRTNKDTLPLRCYKRIMKFTYYPIKEFIRGYTEFLKERRKIILLWNVIWALNFNLVSVAVAFFAYYFYFVVSFRIGGIFIQFCKLIIDMGILFRTAPWIVYVILGYKIFDRFRRRIGDKRLRHYEARNCGFINELPIVSMTCGSMGKKKTTIITDMALSQAAMFRQRAFEIIQKADIKFPFFPWICLEEEIRKSMEYGEVYNLATVKEMIEKKRSRYERHKREDLQLYGYDTKRYGTHYDNSLRINDLFEIIKEYAEAYFIYITGSSLIVSNYAIRDEFILLDSGNFPIWMTNFFPEQTSARGRFSHILDFDILRLGKKVLENNAKAGSFEYGVVAITEIGKERGNNLELREVKKESECANQKNDLFNAWLKMCRHSASVSNYPFIKVFTDEQRPESWGADARDLCDIIRIITTSEEKLSMPMYSIEEMVSEWLFDKFMDMYYEFRYMRGDNTLLIYLMKSVISYIWKRDEKIHNRYGYSIAKIEKERGTMTGRSEKKKYYIMNKKIYSRRFETDCFSDYFNELAKKSGAGLNDYREYKSEKADVGELREQNSYFINDLYGK